MTFFIVRGEMDEMRYIEKALISIGKEDMLTSLEEITASCFELMQPTLLEYVPNEKLKIKFPVLDMYLNLVKSMQGGFISAAFDNAFGMLCLLSTENKAVSLDLNTNYHKPIYENDQLVISVYLKHKGNTLINMYAEAFNSNDELVATADSKMMFIR
jgi:uncharacterized protein (TIGR00369 family)